MSLVSLFTPREATLKAFRLALFALLAAFSVNGLCSTTLGAFYDPERAIWIFEHSWFYPIGDKWKAFGFNEFYHEPASGFPQNSNVWFGKTWIMREYDHGLSVGVELEHGYNNGGMWTRGEPFRPSRVILIPKIGVQWKIN